MSSITMIAAVGRRGQLGLDGGLPWGHDFASDRKRFREKTTGGVVIVGLKTWPSVKHLDGTYGRRFLIDDVDRAPFDLAHAIAAQFGNPDIWIAGGAKTYQRWMRRCTDFDITVLPYDGPATVWMPPITWS